MLPRDAQPWRDEPYRALAEVYDVGACVSAKGCARGYSALRHNDGYADNQGTVHWVGWDRPAMKKGLHKLLVLIAIIKLKHFRRHPPVWEALYEREVWAMKEGMSRYRVRFPISYSLASRRQALDASREQRVPIAMLNHSNYLWMLSADHQGKEDR